MADAEPDTTEQSPPRAPWRKKRWLPLATAATVLVLAGGIAGAVVLSAGETPKIVLNGALTMPSHPSDDFDLSDGTDYNTLWGDDGASCSGKGGYEDIDEGTSVTIYSAADTVIATGLLEKGVIVDDAHDAAIPSLDTYNCEFDFSIPDVPQESFYKVEVSHRGQVVVSLADVRSGGAQLTLGS